MIGHAHVGEQNPEGVGYAASTEDINGAMSLGVPGIVINIFENIEVYGPVNRDSYEGNPGLPRNPPNPLSDIGEAQRGP